MVALHARLDRLEVLAGASGHAHATALRMVEGELCRVLTIKAAPPVYEDLTFQLSAYLAAAYGERREEVVQAATEIAEMGRDVAAMTTEERDALDLRALAKVRALDASLKAGAGLSAKQASDYGRMLSIAYKLGQAEVAKPLGWQIDFALVDQDVIHGMRDSGLFWIGEAHGDLFDQDRAMDLVRTHMVETGQGRRVGGDVLEAAFGDQFDRSKSYWEGLSSTMTTRARSFGAMGSMAELGATRYEYINPDDERTSEVCSLLNGTTFTVAAGLSLRNELLAAKTPEAWKAIAPWPRARDLQTPDGAMLSASELRAKGIVWPPLHFRCRSSVDVAVWGPLTIDDRDPLGHVDLGTSTRPSP